MIPCKNCVVLAICNSIISEGIDRLNMYQKMHNYFSIRHLDMKMKTFLTQEAIDVLVNSLVDRCSIMSDYLVSGDVVNEERYSKVRQFYNLNQGEYNNADITVV